MATTPTSIGPIGARQINRNFYVGQSDLATIQKAVTVAVAIGSGNVIIPAGYTGVDTIAAVTGGSTSVYISDQRTTSPQNYAWSGTNYMPADFNQLANIRGVNGIFSESVSAQQDLACGQDLIVEGNGSFGETVSIEGDVSAANADFSTCEVANSPVRTFANTPDGPGQGMVWPPDGVPVSLGDHWQNPSIDPDSLATWPAAGVPVSTGAAWSTPINPATLATYPAAGIAVSSGTAWSTPINPATLATYPAAGVPVSTGAAWGAPIPAADIARLSQANTFVANQTINGANQTINGVLFAAFANLRILFSTTLDVGTPSIVTDGNSLNLNAGGPSFLRLNWDHGSEVLFGNGAGANVGSVSSVGNATFAGTITASAKSFLIPHPLDDSKTLRHGSIEGPELGVYYRGEGITEGGWAEIVLPDYFEALVREEDRTVSLTPLFEDEADQIGMLAASRVKEGKFKVWSALGTQKFYWEVKAVRGDIDPLEVEAIDTEPSQILNRRTEALNE